MRTTRSGVTTKSRHGPKVADLVAVSVAIAYLDPRERPGDLSERTRGPRCLRGTTSYCGRALTLPAAQAQAAPRRDNADPTVCTARQHPGRHRSSRCPDGPSRKVPRLLSRDSTTCVSFREGAIIVETTRYNGWERFRELIDDALHARLEVGDLDGVERVGLRYIDELRVPDQTDTNWQQWVDESLLGPTQVGEKLGLQPTQWQGITIFTPGTDRTVALRYGPNEGYAVEPGGELKRPTPVPGPFFLLDIDSFWMPGEGDSEFDVDGLMAISDDLHTPVRELFENLITEELREEVLRRGD